MEPLSGWFEGEVFYCKEGFPSLIKNKYPLIGGDFKDRRKVCIVNFGLIAK